MLCKHNNLILPKSSDHHQLTETPRAISNPFDIQCICIRIAHISQDSQETHHISEDRKKTDDTLRHIGTCRQSNTYLYEM